MVRLQLPSNGESAAIAMDNYWLWRLPKPGQMLQKKYTAKSMVTSDQHLVTPTIGIHNLCQQYTSTSGCITRSYPYNQRSLVVLPIPQNARTRGPSSA